ncbi:hypothetical protein ACFP1Z_22320 [Streptomyces gamaensis]|uniref:Uncharacterized protein n=1 Tax=Streptomyces gamaensis TaxID=1763542 RepID=A0ABW0Z2E0_9ACTN
MPHDPYRAAGPGRRAFALGAAGLLTAACSGGGGRTSPAAPSPSGLPRTSVWRPDPSDVRPAVKERAVRLVEALGAWRPGGGGAAGARERVAALGLGPALVAQAGGLLPGAEEAALQVDIAQYGGILADAASVLVVCRQWTRGAGGPVAAGGTTVDVRLERAAPDWSVSALRPAAPGPAAASLPEDARKVLADPRIRLPVAAAADVRSGAVHAGVLRAMLRLAERYRMDVSVVRSGHPLDVFGTDRPSDHPRGRAFDVWRIDGAAVVDRATPRPLIERFIRDAAAAGSYNVGGPVLLEGGAAGQFFSDDTHHDHVHLGFTA